MGCNAVCQDLDCPFLALHHIIHHREPRGGSICLIYSTTTAAVLPVYPPIPSHIIYIAGWFGVGMGGWFSWVEMEVMATLLYIT